MGGYVGNNHVKEGAGIDPHKVNASREAVFLAPVVGATDGATAAGMSILGYTDASSGSLSATAGDFDLEAPDVVRGLELFVLGDANSSVTGVAAQLDCIDNHGVQRTLSIEGVTLSATGPVHASFSTQYGVAQLLGLEVQAAGGTLANLQVGVAPGPELAVPDNFKDGGAIIHEAGQTSAPAVTEGSALFTPGTTLDGSNNVVIRYHLSSPEAR